MDFREIIANSIEIISNLLSSDIFWTIITGVFVFAISQLIMEIHIKPLQDYRKLRARIASTLVLYANRYSESLQLANSPHEKIKDEYENISFETRKLATELLGIIEYMPRIHFGIPSKKRLYSASRSLIGLSNGLYKPYNINDKSSETNNKKEIDEIKKILKIYGYKIRIKQQF